VEEWRNGKIADPTSVTICVLNDLRKEVLCKFLKNKLL
jgi:hypothetical protein